MIDECVFCEIIAGTSPAEIVEDWVNTLVIRPLDPVVPGHLLVIPKRHVADFADNPLETAVAMIRAAEYVQAAGGEYNLITSKGVNATQSVFHLHVHLVPRRAGDQLMLPWGTTGDPHEAHWCKVAQGLKDQLDGAKLFNPDLRWHPGTGEMTSAQLAAIHTRHADAIRPIPSATALGHEHVMADADRGALLAELNRAMERAYHAEEAQSHANCQPEAWAAAARVARELREALTDEREENIHLREKNERLNLEVVQNATGAQVVMDAGVSYLQEVKRLEKVVEAAKAFHGPDDPEFLKAQGWAYCKCGDDIHPCDTARALGMD